MKITQLIKKNALFLIVALVVILFIYYVYINQTYEHLSTTTPRICVQFNNTMSEQTVYASVYALDSDYDTTTPKYTAKKVLDNVAVEKSKSKNLSFKTGNYGFIVSVNNNSTDTASTYTLTNLRKQVKATKKVKNWLGQMKKKSYYKCSNENMANPNASTSTSPTVVNSSGTTISGNDDLNILSSAVAAAKKYSHIYVNSSNSI